MRGRGEARLVFCCKTVSSLARFVEPLTPDPSPGGRGGKAPLTPDPSPGGRGGKAPPLTPVLIRQKSMSCATTNSSAREDAASERFSISCEIVPFFKNSSCMVRYWLAVA